MDEAMRTAEFCVGCLCHNQSTGCIGELAGGVRTEYTHDRTAAYTYKHSARSTCREFVFL